MESDVGMRTHSAALGPRQGSAAPIRITRSRIAGCLAVHAGLLQTRPTLKENTAAHGDQHGATSCPVPSRVWLAAAAIEVSFSSRLTFFGDDTSDFAHCCGREHPRRRLTSHRCIWAGCRVIYRVVRPLFGLARAAAHT